MAETLPIVVPVRYSGGGLTMQTTSSRLSAEGVFVRGFVTPKEGAVLSLTLTLPGVPQPIQAKGVITERVMPGEKGAQAGGGGGAAVRRQRRRVPPPPRSLHRQPAQPAGGIDGLAGGQVRAQARFRRGPRCRRSSRRRRRPARPLFRAQHRTGDS